MTTKWLARLIACLLALLTGNATPVSAYSMPTTANVPSGYAYDALAVARVDVHEFGAVVASPSLFSDVHEGSGSSPAAAQGASTTPARSFIATEAGDDAARFVVDSAGNTTLRAQGPNGWLNVSEHAAERMTQRGITIDALDSTLSQPSFQYWQPGANAGWRTGFYDPVSKVFATTANGEVVTVINNASQTYINNVMGRVPPP